ncbi:MAG TPA: division/cell wall cluster transcriptional repressor MraZ [Levilinea sp.]|nr:division/cell wall cluster transcriptional repressor MraZ [Levilinea sp.]
MFFGQYEHTVDEKGRLTIPSRYRDLLLDGAYITQGFDQNLMVLTAAAFERVYARVNRMSLTDPIARQLKRLIFSYADRVEVDRAGRILIPQFLRTSAQLDGAAIMVGVGDYFEIWSPDRWQEQNSILQDGEANAQRYAALDLSVA